MCPVPVDLNTLFTIFILNFEAPYVRLIYVNYGLISFVFVDSYFSFLFILRGKFSYWVVSYFNRHILRLGGFHNLSCFLSSIGKLWADGGLRDLLVDSGVYVGNTAELMLVGKEFNRDVRGFTLVFEAIQVVYRGIHTLV